MKSFLVLSLFILLASCSKSSSDAANPGSPQPSADEKNQPAVLPDKIRCRQDIGPYELILVLRDPKLPKDVTAVALKKNQALVFKIATQLYQDENSLLNFIEIPASDHSKEAKLHFETKDAVLLNFHADELPDGSVFHCQF